MGSIGKLGLPTQNHGNAHRKKTTGERGRVPGGGAPEGTTWKEQIGSNKTLRRRGSEKRKWEKKVRGGSNRMRTTDIEKKNTPLIGNA